MEKFYGKHYQMVKSENFDQMMIFLDIGFFQRKVGMKLKPVQFLVHNKDGTYSLHYQSTLINFQLVFTPGEEFVDTKPDGVKVRTLITIEGNKLFHRQVEANGRTLNHVYEFFPDKMIITTTGPGLAYTVKRHYIAVK